MATKAEHITAMKSANPELFKNVNGTRIKLTDSEYEAQIDEWATNAAAQDARDDIETNGGSHADYKAIRRKAYIDSVGDIPDQLDYIYHNGLDAWKVKIKEVKDKYTKP
tara:strand:- start:2032 stop:2358 length:327 start_codon:yes stop_codon:yes gene_type:complete